MSVKQFCLLLFICGAWADIDPTIDVAIKSKVQNVTEDVFHLAKTCASDMDCHHLGKCVTGRGGKFCKCKNGTSGDFCEKVDECVDNPVKCGTLDDVSCVFDVQKEMAVCKCDNETKTYIENEERCMSPCKKYYDCGQYGNCFYVVGDQKFCACNEGASGDYCDVIDQCHNKVVDCGVDNNVTCMLARKGKAFCLCDDGTKGFDYDEKICKGCEGCGGNINIYSVGDCLYRGGIRICNCEVGYYSSEEGKCEDCKCGQDSRGCKLKNGTKICECRSGAANKDGFCQKCDCGSGSGVSVCEFKDEKKVCTCKEGYALMGANGPCKQMCNVTTPCANGGKCIQNMCSCLKGTSGDLCQTIDECRGREKCGRVDCAYNVSSQVAYCKCEDSYIFDDYYKWCKEMCSVTIPCANGGKCIQNECSCLKGTSGDLCQTIDECRGRGKCGSTDCAYNVSSHEAYCKCEGSLIFDDYNRMCRLCSCGSYAKGCKFVEGNKRCNCTDPYKDKLGTCALCFCKGYSNMNGCKFDEYGDMKCSCMKGYAQVGNECKKCDCGDHGKCSLTSSGLKFCSCDEGYTELIGNCKECDCGKNGRCYFDYDRKKRCSCYSEYKEYQGTCKGCYCANGATCEFDKFGFPTCICPSGYGLKNGVCKPCNCEPGTACTFGETNRYSYNENKVCICPKGYADDSGRCHACDCEAEGSNCTFSIGFMHCQCPKGYKEEDKKFSFLKKICKQIDECKNNFYACPSSTTRCVNKPGGYECVCKDGYEGPSSPDDIKRQGCTDINECLRDYKPCDDPAATCVNTWGSYRCECKSGYLLKALSEKRNICGSGIRPWRIGSIVVGVASAIIVIGLLIAIGKRYSS